MDPRIEKLVDCELGRFSVNDYRGLPEAGEFEIVEGSVPVLVSAPHAVTHIRNGKVKPSEDYTGAIALAVAQASGCHALVATRTGEGDPNCDALQESAYKQALCACVAEQGITCVLDVHGMVAASPALVAVGSADGLTVEARPGLDEWVVDSLRSRLQPWCERYGKPVVLNGQYGARGGNTVARTVARECGVPALQIEVATQLRVPARRGGHVPKGERIPFTDQQLPVELATRANADPAAVLALIDALSEVATSVAKPVELRTVNVVAAIIRHEGKILATQRGYGDFAGGWEFPGGKVELGETPEQALVREIHEELGATVAIDAPFMVVDYDYETFHLHMHCFLCHVAEGNIELREHAAGKWLDADTIDSVEWLPADEEVIRALSEAPFL